MLHSESTDTAKVMIYNRFARLSILGKNRNIAQSLQYAQEGLKLAEQVQFEKGRAELHRTIGSAYYFLNDYEHAIEQYRKALDICERLQDRNGIASNYYNIGISYNAQSKYYNSLDFMQKALMLWKQSGRTNLIITAYKSIIELYKEVDEKSLAETYALEALHFAIENGDRNNEAFLNEILARIYGSMDNKKSAEEYFQKSLQIYEDLDNRLEIARITNNMAVHLYKDNPQKTIELLKKTIAIYEEIYPNNYNLFDIYNNLAHIFRGENQEDSTIFYIEKALSKAILSGNLQIMAYAYNTTGMFYMEKGNIARAEKDFRNAYDIALNNGLYNILANTLSGLSSVHYEKGNYKSSVEYLRKHQVISDSISREENKKNIQQVTMQYEFEKDMTEKNEIIREQQQSIRYQQSMVIVISIALICAAILLVLIFRSNDRNRQANVKLEQQHREISNINLEMKELHTVKDKLFSVVAHDLRNPIAALMSVLKLTHMNILDAETQAQMLKDVSKQVDDVYGLLDNLLHWAKSQMQGIVISPVYFDVQNEIRTVMNGLQEIAAAKMVILNNRAGNQEVYADRDMFSVVVRNLATNALKYTSAGGEITIGSELSDKMLVVSVKDTGMGMSQEVQEKLFKLSETQSRRGTDNESGTGLGLVLCADFVKANGGDIWFTSVQGGGSTFYFSVPAKS